MTIVEAVRARLLSLTALTTLVGTRIHTLILPQEGLMPAVRLQQIGEIEFMHLRGSVGILRARVQVDAVAKVVSGGDPYAQAQAVSKAAHGGYVAGVATGLVGWRGTSGGVVITGILPAGKMETYDPDELRQVKVSRDYFVWYEAA